MDDNYDAESLNNENNNVVASDNTRVATNYIKEDLVADFGDEEFSLTDAISDNDDSEVVSDSKAVSGGDDFNKEDYFNPKVKNDNVKVEPMISEWNDDMPEEPTAEEVKEGMIESEKEVAEKVKIEEAKAKSMSEVSSHVLKNRSAVQEVDAVDYKKKSPIDLNDAIGTQERLLELGYDVGKARGYFNKETNKGIQRYLADQGFDIGQTDMKEPIDGIIGRRTLKAIRNLEKRFENPMFRDYDDKEGFLGECSQEQCAETVKYEAANALGTTVDQLANKYGLYGNAWHMFGNIIRSGGKVMYKKGSVNHAMDIQPMDIVQVYTGGGSNYQKEAGAGNPTHVAIVESEPKIDKNGRPYVLIKHNNHKRNGVGKYTGHLYRDKMYIDDMSIYGGFWKGVSVARLDMGEFNLNINGNPNVSVIPLDPENTLEAAGFALESLNGIDNKTNIMRDLNVNEQEYNSLTQAVMGIMHQETGLGVKGKFDNIDNDTELHMKEVASSIVKSTVGLFTDPLNLGEESSRGYGKVKFDTNFGHNKPDLERKYGLTQKSMSVNNDNGSKSAIATMLVLGKNFNSIRLKNKDMSADDALYLAIQKFNRYNLNSKYGPEKKSSIEYAKDKDLSYVNKILLYANKYKTVDGENQVNTIIGDMNKDPRIVAKQILLMLENGELNMDELMPGLLEINEESTVTNHE